MTNLPHLAQFLPPHCVADDGEHELTDVEGVPPVVVRHVAVVLLHAGQPSTKIQDFLKLTTQNTDRADLKTEGGFVFFPTDFPHFVFCGKFAD